MKVWLVIQWGYGDGEEDKIVGVFGSKESAEAKRESMMVPFITSNIKRANGKWRLTHSVEIAQ